jgi:hypothetical protein
MVTQQESIPLAPLDFFISYTDVDEEVAEWIAWCLEEAGYSVRIQKWDFRPGHNFILLMQESTARARKTLIVLSRAYEEAFFTKPEWAAMFANGPTGQNRRFIPVRIEPFTPEGMLKSIIYIDLVDCLRSRNEDEARQRLLNGVSVERAKPNCKPSFPEYREQSDES